MADNSSFRLVRERGWRRGLGNLTRAGFVSWWGTSLWWVQTLIWVGVINFLLAGITWGAGGVEASESFMFYSLSSGLFPPVAVIIIMQDVIVGEKQLGTAAWVLSKPVSRTAFILSKLVTNTAGVLATMVLLPGLPAYLQLSLAAGGPLPPGGFLAGMAVLGLNLLFYLTLTLMLGTLFNHRGPVIGIPLAFLFMQQYLVGLWRPLAQVLPWTLTVPLGDEMQAVVPSLLLNTQPHSVAPIVAALFFSVVFVAVGIWRFEREEL
jgi:ABC-2 type transport system permease protein